MEVKGDGTSYLLDIDADWLTTGVAQCSLFLAVFVSQDKNLSLSAANSTVDLSET